MAPSHSQLPVGALPLLPLRRGVLLPGTRTTIPVGRPRSVELGRSLQRGDLFFVGVQRDRSVDDPNLADLHRVATLARVIRVARSERGPLHLMVEGLKRVQLRDLVSRDPFIKVEAGPLDEPPGDPEAVALTFEQLRGELGELDPRPAPLARLLESVTEAEDAGRFADRAAALLGLPDDEEVQVLLTADVQARVSLVLQLLRTASGRGDLKATLEKRIREERQKAQREHLLREQARAISKELGDDDDELGELKQRLADAELPEEVQKVADKELARLAKLGGQAESGVIRTYLEWIADLPWSKRATDAIDLDAVEARLDADHFGLDDAKKAIVEHLAVLKVGGEARGTILCLAGPPGVGKTSLGQSIADATGRPFVRIALGGVRDEAEIRGHRRTYVGARPGRLLHALKQVAVRNPVILLDEIDKLGQGWQGSPEAALLEVLDPEQNHTFTDHYLELPFDLSEALFIVTANDLSAMTPPLRDRLEIIQVSGYTQAEKVRIARDHLIPTQLDRHHLTDDLLQVTDEALQELVAGWTREAGVRQLQRELRKLCRAAAVRVARATDGKPEPLVVDLETLRELLGRRRFFDEVAERTSQPGVATGMAWTPVGGDILFIETSSMPGKGQLQITGQLGDVMKESARAALTYVRSHAQELDVSPTFLETLDIHIHVPAGGVPKDGPSAGVTMFTALTSLLSNRRVRADVAMTGEVTLRGRVLPVGGIKEKVLAAHRAGLTTIVLPKRNERDLEDLPEAVRDELEFVLADDMSQVLQAALEPAGAARSVDIHQTRTPMDGAPTQAA